MNLGMVVHYYDSTEGTGGYVVELVHRLAAEHQITLYTVDTRAPVPDGVRVVRVPALRGKAYLTILSFPAAFWSVRGRHDLIHAQGWVAPSADVVTAHIVLGAWREAARRAGIRSPLGERIFGGLVTNREASLYRRARAVIAPSRQAQTDIARRYHRTREIDVVPHGFVAARDHSRTAARVALGFSSQDFLAAYIGDARKGLLTAFEAVARVPNVKLVVLSGSGVHSYRAHAERLGLGNRVSWRGHLSDPTPVYCAADALLHPTIYDSFGLVVAEAMAHGLPPIVSRAAGVTELIEHRQSGWLLGDDLIADSAEALRVLAADEGLRQRLGAGARVVARRRTWNQVAAETVQVYARVLERKT